MHLALTIDDKYCAIQIGNGDLGLASRCPIETQHSGRLTKQWPMAAQQWAAAQSCHSHL